MLRPSSAELLTGVADALESTVLDELDRGVARNQVELVEHGRLQGIGHSGQQLGG